MTIAQIILATAHYVVAFIAFASAILIGRIVETRRLQRLMHRHVSQLFSRRDDLCGE